MERLLLTYGGNIRDICRAGMRAVKLPSVWAVNTLADLMFHVLHLALEHLCACVRVCVYTCVYERACVYLWKPRCRVSCVRMRFSVSRL